MPEKTIPWWRKALHFALSGIRSGFGLFPRTAQPEAAAATEIDESVEEMRIEEAASPVVVVEAESVAAEPEPEPMAMPEPEIEVAVEPVEPVAENAGLEPEVDEPPEPESEVVVEDDEAVVEEPATHEPQTVELAQPEPVVEVAEQTGQEEIAELEENVEREPDAIKDSAEEEPTEPVEEVLLAEPEAEEVLPVEVEELPQAEAEAEAVPEPVELEPIEPEPVMASASEPDAEVVEAEADEFAEDAPLELVEEPDAATEEASEAETAPVSESLPEPDAPAKEALQAEPSIESATAPNESTVEVVAAEPEIEFAEETAKPVDEVTEVDADLDIEEPVKVAPEMEKSEDAERLSEMVPEQVEAVEAAVEAQPEILAEGAAAEPETLTDGIASAQLDAPAEGALAVREALSVREALAVREAPPAMELTAEPTEEERAAAKADEKNAARLAARQKKLDESSEQSPFSVMVDKVYDGPLDLLLDLIRKQDIDIYDIPIAQITAQFLAYVNQLKASDVDVAGEFIYTASLLIHIKSKMLLPRAASGPEDASEDPRRELVERLLEHERFKNAAQMLQQKQMLEAASWTNPGLREFKEEAESEPEIAADTVDLVRIFREILDRARKRPVISVDDESVTVSQMIQFLGRRLAMEDKPVALRSLLRHTRSEQALIALFLALLELVRMQAILLRQDSAFSEIFIKKHTGFDALMNQGLSNARDDWR